MERSTGETAKDAPFKDQTVMKNVESGGQSKDRFLFIAALIAVVVGNFVFQWSLQSPERTSSAANVTKQESAYPKYFILGESDTHLKHVIAVLNRLGLRRTFDINDTWDLMWAHDYPFSAELKPMLSNLDSHRRVNHFPAIGHITNKVDLAVSRSPFIPRAFKLPEDKTAFLEYSREHPGAKFVQKHNQHRHIHIRSVDEIDFNDHNSFVQEYIQNPFLVDGHKFDIGVYVAITSIQPLRIYIYKGEILFRYCPNKYHPFDPNDEDKYVVGDKYLPSWKVSALEKYHEMGFGMKSSFDAYVRSLGKDPHIIWNQVEEAITSVVLQKEDHLSDAMRNYQFRTSFFEISRFDLILDENLKVFLLESNMSPNLSSAKFPPNSIIYEQLLFNMFGLLGISSTLARSSFERGDSDTELMMSSMKHLVVEPELCHELPCSESCAPEECSICSSCMNSYQLFDLHLAYREHMRRGDTKRIFPRPIQNVSSAVEYEDLSPKNRWMSRWFRGKCKLDVTWCN